MSRRYIMPECYVDTCLIETLLPLSEGYNHQKCCTQVAKTMKDKFKDDFALGIIDKDKKEVSYLQEFNLEIETDSLLLLKHRDKYHYIIQVIPAAEKFIINAAASVGVNLSDFELSTDLDELRSYTKRRTSKDDPKLKEAFKGIRDAASCQLLKKWVKYLNKNKFSSSIEELNRITKDILG